MVHRLVSARLQRDGEQHRAMDAVGNIYRRPDPSERHYGRGGGVEEADGSRYRHDDDGNLVEKSVVLGVHRLVWARLQRGEEQHRAMDAVGNIYRTPDLSDRRYGRGGRIKEADGSRYRHDDDGNLVEKTDVLVSVLR